MVVSIISVGVSEGVFWSLSPVHSEHPQTLLTKTNAARQFKNIFTAEKAEIFTGAETYVQIFTSVIMTVIKPHLIYVMAIALTPQV